MRVSKIKFFEIVFISVVAVACHHPEVEKPLAVEKVGPETVRLNKGNYVKTGSVTRTQFAVTAEFNGRVTVPDKDILALSSRISGRLEALNVSVGDRVRAGELIGKVWSPDLATAAQEYEIAKREGGDLLRLTLQKLSSLGISPAEARVGQSSFGLRSTVDGVVLEKKISAGSSLNPGDVILTIGKSGALQFIGDLAPEQAVKIKRGMPVVFDEVASLRAIVENVSPISDPNTHMVRVRCKFLSKLPDDVPQESFLKSRIELSQIEGLVVPSRAVIFDQGSDVIFVRDEADKTQMLFRRTKIAVKSRASNSSAIEIPNAKQTTFEIITDGALLVNYLLDDTGQE